jgi:hypothetical protein
MYRSKLGLKAEKTYTELDLGQNRAASVAMGLEVKVNVKLSLRN